MHKTYRIFGAEMSPYSVKVRSFFRYKSIPHQWLPRTMAQQEEFRRYARLPLIPLVVTPEGEGLQDSTPILERLETEFPEPSMHPDDPRLAFLSALLEEYADEWGNKLMFHYRWWREADQIASAWVLARSMLPDADDETMAQTAVQVRQRMTGRGDFVGSNASTAPLIHKYFRELIDMVEAHLERRPYLFGQRPAFADFGLAHQLYECALDPSAGGIIRARYERTLAWCYRMLEPRADGPFEAWEDLAPTLLPLLADVGQRFLPWSCANAVALAQGQEEFSVDLDGDIYVQPPQKYHAKSLRALRAKYAAIDKTLVDPILEQTGCKDWLDMVPTM